MKVGYIGLGKLGLECAEVFAETHEVVGYDLVPKQSDAIRIVATIQDVVQAAQFVFVAVQTPHHPDYDGSQPSSEMPPKDFDYEFVKNVLTEVNRHVTSAQTVVLISTVLPGICRSQLRPLITEATFIYNPYLIAMGTVKDDMVNPEMVIIGSDTGAEAEWKPLRELYESILKKGTRYIEGTYEEAESIKIFYNTFISAKISLVNMIQDVALRLGHMNVDVVTRALAASTKRIMGAAYMKAGMGDGGPCHPRDNIALRHLAQHLDLGYDLFGSIMESREAQASNMAAFLQAFHLPVVILGESYKPGVPFTDGSSARLVGFFLQKKGIHVQYDMYMPYACTYLLAHDIAYADTHFAPNSILVDPWRNFTSTREDVNVIHYGNTRK